MPTIYLAVEVERTEGKFATNEDVASEVAALIDGESLDVVDSVYDVTSVDVIDSPKSKQSKPAVDDTVLLALDEAFKAHAVAFPIRLDDDDDDPKDNLTLNQMAFVYAFERLMLMSSLGDAIRKAQMRAWKKEQKARS